MAAGGDVVNLIGSARAAARRAPLASALSGDGQATLEARLRDVRRWWRQLDADRPVAERARTAALEPALEEETTPAALEAVLHRLAERRVERLDRAVYRSTPADPLPEGRLLVCALDMSIGDGGAEAASRSLVDADDRPPWDLWLVAFARTRPARPDEPITCLVAWIPAEWLSLAQAAIDACPSGALEWAE